MSQGASLPPSRLSGESSGHPPVSPPVTYAHGRTPPSSRARHFTTQAFVHGPYTVRARRVLVRHHLAVPTALYCGSDRAQNHQAEHGDRRLLGEERTPRGSTRPKYARPTNPHYPMPTVSSPYRAAPHHSPPLAPHEHPALAHAHAPRCDPREWDSGGGIRPSTSPGRWARRQGLNQQAHCS